MTGPYSRAYRAYREAGWLGVLPIVGKKVGLPAGYTGGAGLWPEDAQVQRWEAERGQDNIVLRLPDDVIGIDIDAYDGRAGLETIASIESMLGVELPPTWTSGARTDGSGIKFFRVPEGLAWKSDLGRDSGVEIIRFGHRYAVVWPSVHPDIGLEYLWRLPTGEVTEDVPTPGEFPRLPDEWVAGLTKPRDDSSRARSGSGEHNDVNAATGVGDGGGDNDAPVIDQNGNPIDVEAIFTEGIPQGSQNQQLFSYMCSLRARNMRRVEMISLGMLALQRLKSDPGDPWTPEHIVAMVNRVRREYPAGMSSAFGLGRGAAGFVAGFGTGGRGESGAGGAQGGGGRRVRGVVMGEGADGVPDLDRDVFATDLGNSLRVVRTLGDRLRFAADEGIWYVWDDKRWAPDRFNRALDLTKEVIDDIRLTAATSEGDERARWQNWARDSESLGRRRSMLMGAEAEPSLVITTDALDVDPDLLVVRNGTLDLKTGELRSSRREDVCSRLAEVDFDPDAQCPLWLGHVNFVCANDPVLAAYMRRAVGYTLTGQVGARNFFFMEGTGSNGKNAFIEPIMQMMGSYAQTATTALLTGGDEQHPTILADLLGTRLVFIDETRQGKPLNVERVKALTGSKRVKARRMGKDFFEFDAQFKLWIAGNGKPVIRDTSDGVWNRMHRILCRGKVIEGKAIDRFGELLYREEASGILNWALEGLLDWRQLGSLGVPASIKNDVKEYRDEENYLMQFVDDMLVVTGDAADFIPSRDVYLYYQQWAVEHGLKGIDVKNQIHFSRDISALNLGIDNNDGKQRMWEVGGVKKKIRGFSKVRWASAAVEHP